MTKKIEDKTIDKKEEKTKKKEKKEKVSFIQRVQGFIHGVKTEWKRVKWPTKKNMVKYSIATIVFIISCSLFFYFIDVILAFFHTLGK